MPGLGRKKGIFYQIAVRYLLIAHLVYTRYKILVFANLVYIRKLQTECTIFTIYTPDVRFFVNCTSDVLKLLFAHLVYTKENHTCQIKRFDRESQYIRVPVTQRVEKASWKAVQLRTNQNATPDGSHSVETEPMAPISLGKAYLRSDPQLITN